MSEPVERLQRYLAREMGEGLGIDRQKARGVESRVRYRLSKSLLQPLEERVGWREGLAFESPACQTTTWWATARIRACHHRELLYLMRVEASGRASQTIFEGLGPGS